MPYIMHKKEEVVEITCHQKDLYFQLKPWIDPQMLKMTNVSLYSMTPWKEARIISRAILQFYSGKSHANKSITITDACANVGGNTISFHLHGIKNVNSVEIEPRTCDLLKKNL